MDEPRCPESILRLFDQERTRAEGRVRAIEWLKAQLPDIPVGGGVWIPDPETGALMRFVKNANAA